MLGHTGISFPFRIGNRGGIVLSSTNKLEVPHINESIQQILGTSKRERVMNEEFGSELDTHLFDPNDEASNNLIKFQIVESLEIYEPRIKVEEENITLIREDNKLIAKIEFEVISYQSSYRVNVELGGENDENTEYRL